MQSATSIAIVLQLRPKRALLLMNMTSKFLLQYAEMFDGEWAITTAISGHCNAGLALKMVMQ